MAPHLGVHEYTNWTRGEDTGGVQGGGVALRASGGVCEYKKTYFMEFSKKLVIKIKRFFVQKQNRKKLAFSASPIFRKKIHIDGQTLNSRMANFI